MLLLFIRHVFVTIQQDLVIPFLVEPIGCLQGPFQSEFMVTLENLSGLLVDVRRNLIQHSSLRHRGHATLHHGRLDSYTVPTIVTLQTFQENITNGTYLEICEKNVSWACAQWDSSVGEWRANSDVIVDAAASTIHYASASLTGGSLDFQVHLAAFPLTSATLRSTCGCGQQQEVPLSPHSVAGTRDLHCIYLATHDLLCVRRLESQCHETQCRTRHDTVVRVVSRWSSF